MHVQSVQETEHTYHPVPAKVEELYGGVASPATSMEKQLVLKGRGQNGLLSSHDWIEEDSVKRMGKKSI